MSDYTDGRILAGIARLEQKVDNLAEAVARHERDDERRFQAFSSEVSRLQSADSSQQMRETERLEKEVARLSAQPVKTRAMWISLVATLAAVISTCVAAYVASR